MRLINKEIERDGSGRVTVLPDDQEDLWHLFNVLREGDTVKSKTIRKVQKETSSGTGASERKVLNLVLKITKIEYDAVGGYMRLSGTNMTENDFVKLGAFHTSEIEMHQEITIGKGCWDKLHEDVLDEACDAGRHADIAAIAMQEGIAHICLVTSTMCIVKAKVECPIPKKRRGGAAQHDKALQRFFEQIIVAMQNVVKWDVIKVVLVGSPGFLRDDFLAFMNMHAIQHEKKDIMQNKGKFLSCSLSSGFKHSLKEAFVNPEVSQRLADTKAARDSRAFEDFQKLLNDDPDRVTYGTIHVKEAAEKQAVETLMISDALFHCHSTTRQMYIALMDSVVAAGGEVLKFSSLHVSGENLNLVTGIAAILRYPCPELDNIEEDLKPLEPVVRTPAS